MDYTTVIDDLNYTDWTLGGSPNMTRKEKEYEESRRMYIYSVAFICFTLFVGVVFREWSKKFHLPYTALLFLFGCVMGLLDNEFESLQVFTELAKFDSRLLMHIFLPAIIYESAFSLDPHMFFMVLTQCLLLAVPGLIICTLLTGVFAKFIFESYNWSWSVCFMFGSILSATDPVAVVALLKDCGISPSLTTIIEGESLLNDGSAIVLFHSLLSASEKGKFSMMEILYEFIYNGVVSVAVSYLICMGTIALLRRIELDTDVEVTFTFCIAYLTYYLNEITFKASGVLSMVVLGVCISNYKSSLNYEEEEETTVHQFWQTLSFWANTLIFTIVGVIIASRNISIFYASDVGFLLAAYVAVSAFRAFMVWILSGLLKRTGYGFTWNYAVVLTWGGLRGAVGLALVLIARHSIIPTVADQLLKQVSGIIFLTLVVNAPSMRILLKLLGIGQVTEKNIKCMNRAITLLRDSVSMTEKTIRMDKYLVGVDWMWVRQITYFENPYEKVKDVSTSMNLTLNSDMGHCPECNAEIKFTPNDEEIAGLQEDSRIRILQALQSSVWLQHSCYRTSRRTLQYLNTSVENAMDEKGKFVLSDELIKKYLIIGKFTRLMRRIMRSMEEFSLESRQNRGELYLKTESKGFRKWCIRIYFNRRSEVVLYWVLLLNVIPIAGEIIAIFLENKHVHYEKTFDNELIVFETINAFLAVFYILDSVVGIGSLGCREYFRYHGNKIDFFITVIAAVQMIIGIIVIAYRIYSFKVVYLFAIMSCFRLVRLLRVTLSGILSSIMDGICSIIYDAYDFSVGFIVANVDIVRNASKLLHYEPSVDLAQFTAENNIVQMMAYMDDLEREFPDVTNAWTTQSATVYVLRDMKFIVQEMQDIYMFDESDAELLLEELALKTKDTFCGPRFMPTSRGVKKLLTSVPWVKNEDMVEMLLNNSSVTPCSDGDIIQVSGTKHQDVKIITAGIVQVMGQNDGEKHSVLPNTDSLEYFGRKGLFCDYLVSLDALGVLGYLLGTNCVTSATCSKDSELICLSYENIRQVEKTYGDLTFEMWRPIALKIAEVILLDEEVYEYWTKERIKMYLEGGIFPNLQESDHFEVSDEAVTDMVLIQGRVQDSYTEEVYIGPSYLPSSVRNLTLLDDLDGPRVILILLRKERYHSHSIMGWIKPKDINLKGLCLVHGIRKTSLIAEGQMRRSSKRRKSTFVQAIGRLFSKEKNGDILNSDAP